jgi:type IV secretion system protein TrbG
LIKKICNALCIFSLTCCLTIPTLAATNNAQKKVTTNTKNNTEDVSNAIAKQADYAFTYIPNKLYKVYCKVGYLTDIQLQIGEEISFVGGGDTARWMVDQATSGIGINKRWHLYVKPLRAGISTNLVINTDKHSYNIELIAANFYSPVVSWVYPKEEGAGIIRNDLDEMDSINNGSSKKYNRNYKILKTAIFSNPSWKPVSVYDDGKKTYIEMPKSMVNREAPVLYVRQNGQLLMVNYRVKNTVYIVDRLFEEAEMRNGKERIVILKK